MTVEPEVIERIYEAAALPDRWPTVLCLLSDRIGAVGASFVSKNADGVSITPSLGMERLVAEYVAEGWAADPAYAEPLLRDQYPGFRAETHYRTMEEIERLPVHVRFLAPRGLVASVGTVLQGSRDNIMHLAFEGLATHAAAEAAGPQLDALRAPLARALSLTALLRDRQDRATVAGLETAGVAAALVSGDGRLRAANRRFELRFGDRASDTRAGLRFGQPQLQAQFADVLARLARAPAARSIAAPATGEAAACVLHLVPLRRGAREVFGWDGVLLIAADGANAAVPDADLLRLLFDLTPAEARLTRRLVEGQTLAAAAAGLSIMEATARVHLRRVFAKTGVGRQAELVRLLSGLGRPG